MFNADQKRITQTQMQKYFANTLSLISSIMSQQTFDQFKRHIRFFKSFTTFVFTSRTITTIRTFTIINRENSSIYDVSNDNSSKKRRMINQLRNISMINSFHKSVFIALSKLSSRINFNSNLFNSTKNDTNVARTILRRKHDMRIKKFKFND